MNWAQFKDAVFHLCLAGAVVASWSLTQNKNMPKIKKFLPKFKNLPNNPSPPNDKYFCH